MIHKCIRLACGQSYESEEEDAYYCSSCQERNKEIAAKLKVVNHLPRSGLLAKYNSLPKVGGFVRARDMM